MVKLKNLICPAVEEYEPMCDIGEQSFMRVILSSARTAKESLMNPVPVWYEIRNESLGMALLALSSCDIWELS